MITESEIKLSILHTEPSKMEEGKQLIESRRKNVAETLRYRAVFIPAIAFSAVFEPESIAAAMQGAIAAAVEDAAKEILASYTQGTETAEKATEVPASMFTLENIVARMQEQQTSVRLNGDQIASWYDSSKTKGDAATRYGADEAGTKKQNALREKYKSLASNNPAIDSVLASKMVAYINEEDTEHAVCKAVLKRLERLMQTKVNADEL